MSETNMTASILKKKKKQNAQKVKKNITMCINANATSHPPKKNKTKTTNKQQNPKTNKRPQNKKK